MTPSYTGDMCHCDIFGWSKSNAENTVKRLPIDDFRICTAHGTRNLSKNDLI